jgi:TonB family protein
MRHVAGHRQTGPIMSDEADPRTSRFGEPEGSGYAMNSLVGEGILHAREGPQDQAWLSRDPVGPGRMLEEPSFSTALPGVNGDGAPKSRSGRGRPSLAGLAPEGEGNEEAAPFGVGGMRIVAAPKVALRPPVSAGGADSGAGVIGPSPAATQAASQADAEASGPPVAVVAVAPAAARGSSSAGHGGDETGGSGPAGPPIPPADPGPLSDSESDPFSRIGSAVISPGGVQARLGRKVKTIKPRLPLKGELDLVSLMDPSVILKVSIDETGRATDVSVLKSSGSNEVDLPTRLAIYKWWIEPGKDKQGKSVPDVILLQITWH